MDVGSATVNSLHCLHRQIQRNCSVLRTRRKVAPYPVALADHVHRLRRSRSHKPLQWTSYIVPMLPKQSNRAVAPCKRRRTTSADDSHAPSSDHPNSLRNPSQRGIGLPSLPTEAILALLLSINVRNLLADGADALLKAAAKKFITFLAALLLATLLHYLEDAYPPFSLVEEANDIRTMAGILSGWFGQCLGECVGYRIELRIGEWLSQRQLQSNKDSSADTSLYLGKPNPAILANEYHTPTHLSILELDPHYSHHYSHELNNTHHLRPS